MKNNNLAPVVIFAFNRYDHLKKTIESLKDNSLSKYTDVIIYNDYFKNKADAKSVEEVRNYTKNIKYFKSIKIINRRKNYGLAKSIRSGVTEVLLKYKKIIVLEDDITSSKFFLDYMNKCLNKFKNKKKIWHINAWNYPKFQNKKKGSIYFDRMMNCWGWGTWLNRWEKLETNTNKIIKLYKQSDIKKFNIDGYENFWSHLLANKYKILNTWAIYWYATIFINKGLCVRPSESYTNNIGIDGTGEHCQESLLNFYKHNSLNPKKISLSSKKLNIEESTHSIQQVKKFYYKQNFFLFRYINRVYEIITKLIKNKPKKKQNNNNLQKYLKAIQEI